MKVKLFLLAIIIIIIAPLTDSCLKLNIKVRSHWVGTFLIKYSSNFNNYAIKTYHSNAHPTRWQLYTSNFHLWIFNEKSPNSTRMDFSLSNSYLLYKISQLHVHVVVVLQSISLAYQPSVHIIHYTFYLWHAHWLTETISSMKTGINKICKEKKHPYDCFVVSSIQ